MFSRFLVKLLIYRFGLKERSKVRSLSNAPFDRFSLAMYPSDQNFLKALFLRAPSAASGGNRAISAQSYIDKDA